MNVLKEFYELTYAGTDIVSAYFICKEKTVALSKNSTTQNEKEDAAAQGLLLMMQLAFYSLEASEEEKTIINNILYPFNLLPRAFIIYSASNFIFYADEEDINKRYEKSIKFNDVAVKVIQNIAHLLKEKNND